MTNAVTILSLLAVVAAVAGQAQAQSRPSGTSGVSGRVVTSSSSPVADATVTLLLQPDAGRAPIASWTARTDADGAYRIDNLPTGRYSAASTKTGFWSTNALASPVIVPSQHAVIEMVPGGTISQVDFVLRRSGRISGQVVTQEGLPAAGMLVSIRMPNPDGGTIFVAGAPTLKTDSTGRYEITNAPPGTYFVAAVDFNGFVSDPNSRTLVTVAEGAAVTGIDIRIMPPDGLSIGGRVVDLLGVIPRKITIEYGTPGSNHASLQTLSDDRNGTFLVSARDIQPGTVTVFARGETDDGIVIGFATITAIDGPNDVTVTVGRPGALRGRVTLENASLGLLAPQIALTRVGFVPLGEVDAVIDIAPDGWFDIAGVLGEYSVQVRQPEGWRVRAVRRRGAQVRDDLISVAHGETLDDLEIVIGPR